MSAIAIRALNKGAQLGNFYHDTGEGKISPAHLENGGDLVWELGSGLAAARWMASLTQCALRSKRSFRKSK